MIDSPYNARPLGVRSAESCEQLNRTLALLCDMLRDAEERCAVACARVDDARAEWDRLRMLRDSIQSAKADVEALLFRLSKEASDCPL